MATGKVAESPRCATPIERINQLANSLGINGTPTMILQDGSLIPGAAHALKLIGVWRVIRPPRKQPLLPS